MDIRHDQNFSSPFKEEDDDEKRSTSAGSQSEEENTHDKIKDRLSERETQAVFRLRVIVVLILIAAAASISVTIYFLTRNAEIEEFETQFEGIAEKIIQTFQDIMVEISAVSGLAVAASAEGLNNGNGNETTWPFIALNQFQERAGNARTLSGAIYVSINPLVQADQLEEWEDYVLSENKYWIQEGLEAQEVEGLNDFGDPELIERSWLTNKVVDPLHTFDDTGKPFLSTTGEALFLPRWQTSPVLRTSMVNENLLEKPHVKDISRACFETKSAVLGGFVTAPAGSTSHSNPDTSFFATLQSMWEGEQVEYQGDPMSHLTMPVFKSLKANENAADREVVAVLKSTIYWRYYLTDMLPSTVKGIIVVVENACDGRFTYEINGQEARVVGFGDQHEAKFEDYEVSGVFTTEWLDDGTVHGVRLNQEECPYSFHVYPSEIYYNDFTTAAPVQIAVSVAAVFLFTILMFLAYDRLVERRQRIVLATAKQSSAIVSSLFPKKFRERLMEAENDKGKGDSMLAQNHRLNAFLNGNNEDANDSKPIADLFPECTVLFADISGFTAWSSTREPSQVFILLQSVYQAFDAIAKRRKVFKVETIGDSYVAVTGLPEPQANHATNMAKFAWECLLKIHEVTKELEVQLGPDTGDLTMRFGLHSGPVTAGVLKGDRARFQLFGDTVNTAARMESTGARGKIQVSQKTADYLLAAGKNLWITPRSDAVHAKGKGVMKTYWLLLSATVHSASVTSSHEDNMERKKVVMENGGLKPSDLRQARLVGWVVDLFVEQIKKIVVVRERCGGNTMSNETLQYRPPEGKICLDEVKEVINMPEFQSKASQAVHDWRKVEVPMEITDRLREYVTLVANSYRGNPFHNFEHACHVTMSVNKLLSRIVAPDLSPDALEQMKKGKDEVAARIHDHTHGITSDPMAAFAITFSALIHDVDHQGVSNTQLAKEEPELSELYRNKSLAEQISLDVAWDQLMTDEFETLRKYVFGTRSEMMRFRQLIVNIVLATDIFDKELNDLRRSRWERAFNEDGNISKALLSDYRATNVMEHIIQASDVSHTMQHWHVYRKWNQKLFKEMYEAYNSGRMGADPREFWYKGELGFFDNYIIPLAKKLKDCNVFGVSSDEYLNYALMNRAEWEERGQEVVDEMIAELEEVRKPPSCIETPVSDTESERSSSSGSRPI